jgi:hypothetical protein
MKGAKKIMVFLWGALCQYNTQKKYFNKTDEEFDMEGDIKESKSSTVNKDQYIIETYQEQKFINNWARIKPFLLSKGRFEMSKLIEPYKNICVRCHTDSMICTEYPKDIILGSYLGALEFKEHSDHIIVKNIMKVEGFKKD